MLHIRVADLSGIDPACLALNLNDEADFVVLGEIDPDAVRLEAQKINRQRVEGHVWIEADTIFTPEIATSLHVRCSH